MKLKSKGEGEVCMWSGGGIYKYIIQAYYIYILYIYIIFEEIVAENCPSWMKMINAQIQEAQQTFQA